VEVFGLGHVLRQREGGIGVLVCEFDSALLDFMESGGNYIGRSRLPGGYGLTDSIHELKVELARSFDIFLGQLTQLLGNFKLLVLGHDIS
jgi:hypothetical protein